MYSGFRTKLSARRGGAGGHGLAAAAGEIPEHAATTADPVGHRLVGEQITLLAAGGGHHGQPVADLLAAVAGIAFQLGGRDAGDLVDGALADAIEEPVVPL